jgi:cellulose synthase/poly-beta-1,6-N-acetylglucosamine synthase-like glycosyltransferase
LDCGLPGVMSEKRSMPPRVAVIVPTYRRASDLARCLTALSEQEFVDYQVLCVCRSDDESSRACIADFASRDPRFTEVIVRESGVVAALNAGLLVAKAEFVAFTDDDAKAPPHWLRTIVDHFEAHPGCGAVGGPDRLQLPSEPALSNPPPAKRVGVYSWFGRMAATHHHPIVQTYLECTSLKGVNMIFRKYLIADVRIGVGLIGRACTVGWEQSLCAAVRAQKMRLHFVRDAWVFHFCAPRTLNDSRVDPSSEFARDSTYNSTYVLWRFFPYTTAVRAQAWRWLMGSSKVPGVLRVLLNPAGFNTSAAHWSASLRGMRRGISDRITVLNSTSV